jgi:hypothetical protein
MDSLGNLDNSVRRKFKKVFERLSEDYIVRTPVLDDVKVAHIMLEGPGQSWLLIGSHKTLPDKSCLTKYLTLNSDLKQLGFEELKYLAVCKKGESLFSKKDPSLIHVHVIKYDDFWNSGEKYIADLLLTVENEAYVWLKKRLIFESVINSACTTRRNTISNDTSTKLQDFFLDYDQELATKYDFWGGSHSKELEDDFSVRLINGVAGCGKTLILINRAILYCKKYPDKKALLLIHNKPVTADVEFKLEKYLGGKPINLTVKTFHAYARAQQVKITPSIKILFSDKDKKPFREKIFSGEQKAYTALSQSDEQIWSELEFINEFLIRDKDHYLSYDRQGRGFALSKSQRENIWQLYELACELMSSPKEGFLPSLYIRNLCLSQEYIPFDRYDHVLIDEAQFFFPSWLELVKKSIKEDGQLFLCADPNQGFLKSRLSWKSVGLNVRGRTKKLSYSYRTTYEIMVAANALLEHLNDDPEDFVQPDLEKMDRGSKPQVIYCNSSQDEQKRFVNELVECVNKNEIPLPQIIVLCSESVKPWNIKKVIQERLGNDTVANCHVNEDLGSLGDKIRVMSINCCTGMEAGVIFVLGVGYLLDKANNLDLNEDEKVVVHQESTRKLYVAMTRAGQKLIVFSNKRLPENVEALMTAENDI